MLFRLSEVCPAARGPLPLLSQLFTREAGNVALSLFSSLSLSLSFCLEVVSKTQYRSAPSELFRVSKRRVIVPPSWKYFQGSRGGGLCVYICVCIVWKKRERGERNGSSHGARREHVAKCGRHFGNGAGRRDEIGDAIRCISADEGCNLARTPFIKAASATADTRLPLPASAATTSREQRRQRRISLLQPNLRPGLHRSLMFPSPPPPPPFPFPFPASPMRFYAPSSFYVLPELIYQSTRV